MRKLQIRLTKKNKRLIGSIFARPISRCLLMVGCLMYVSGCVAVLPTPKITHYSDNFVVMETPSNADLSSLAGMVKICREFYRHYEDAFDILVLVYNAEDEVMDRWNTTRKGSMAVVRHDETGTGKEAVDIGRSFGSESRLKGVVQLASPQRIIDGSLLHEIMHLWVLQVDIIPSVIESHWGFSSVGGLLGGFQRDNLLELGDGKYSAGNFFPQYNWGTIPYSELELYLAGWIPPTEVPEIWIAEDGAWLSKELTPEVLAECEIETGPYAGMLNEDCVIQKDSNGNRIFTASKISTWSIEQIIEKLGPRTPSHEQSQKEFRVAFVSVAKRNSALTNSELKLTDLLIEEFTAKQPISDRIVHRRNGTVTDTHFYNFWEAAKGIANLEAGDLQSFRK